jgi:hypothetical protein
MPSEYSFAEQLNVALAIRLADGDLGVLQEIAKYEGLLATLDERRQALSDRWRKKAKAIYRAIHKEIDVEQLINKILAGDNMEASTPSPGSGTAKKVAATAALWVFLRANPEIEAQWTGLIALGEVEGMAAGVTAATALLQEYGYDTGVAGKVDLDQLYTDTLNQLELGLDTDSDFVHGWLTTQLQGVAGDMGRIISSDIENNVGRQQMIADVNALIAQTGPYPSTGLLPNDPIGLYMDEAINSAYQSALVAQMSDLGVTMFDYITQPGACDDCEGLEAGSPYALDALPEIPQHISCRCSSAPAGAAS